MTKEGILYRISQLEDSIKLALSRGELYEQVEDWLEELEKLKEILRK